MLAKAIVQPSRGIVSESFILQPDDIGVWALFAQEKQRLHTSYLRQTCTYHTVERVEVHHRSYCMAGLLQQQDLYNPPNVYRGDENRSWS